MSPWWNSSWLGAKVSLSLAKASSFSLAGSTRANIGMRRSSSTSSLRLTRASFALSSSFSGQLVRLHALAVAQRQNLIELVGEIVAIEHPYDPLALALLEHAAEHAGLRRAVKHRGRRVDHQQIGML